MHVIYIDPGSDAEKRFMELLSEAKARESVHCKLGASFGKPYDTYTFSEETYQKIQKLIEEGA